MYFQHFRENSETIMFPHRFDRYRVLGYIVRQFRRKHLRLSQTKLAEIVGCSQPTISNLENPQPLSNAAVEGHWPVTRDVFTKIATQGLRFSRQDINALLWLIEGEDFKPLGADDFIDAPIVFDYTPEPQNPAVLHAHALGLLQRAVELAKPGDKMGVRMLTGWEEEHQVTFRRELWNMEKKPGQRLLISKYPSYLTYPEEVIEQINRSRNSTLSAAAQQQISRLNARRRRLFDGNLKEYGERCIHSTTTIERYLRPGLKHPLDDAGRKAHLLHLITLLEKYKHFEVGLAPAEPEMEFVIKCGWAASLRSTARELYANPDAVICGPLYIFWDNITTVYSFVVDFERAWNKLPEELRDKQNVIAQLEGFLRL